MSEKPAAKTTSSYRRIGQSLEDTVLRVLAERQAPPVLTAGTSASWVAVPRGKKAGAKKAAEFRNPAAKKAAPSIATDLVPAIRDAADLARAARELREKMREQGLVKVETVHVRPEGKDRQLRVEYAPDPEDATAVLMRVSLISKAPLPAGLALLTTREAADFLNVSRPYIARMVDAGKLSGVERTQSGHRRIPFVEVQRIHSEMRSSRRKALDSVEVETSDLRERELGAAKSKPAKRPWVAKA